MLCDELSFEGVACHAFADVERGRLYVSVRGAFDFDPGKCRLTFRSGGKELLNKEFVWQDGSRTRMEELAYQRWEGERIAEETFFYDPAQRVPRRMA